MKDIGLGGWMWAPDQSEGSAEGGSVKWWARGRRDNPKLSQAEHCHL